MSVAYCSAASLFARLEAHDGLARGGDFRRRPEGVAVDDLEGQAELAVRTAPRFERIQHALPGCAPDQAA